RNLRMQRTIHTLDQLVYRMIAERRSRETERDDLLSMLLSAQDEETGQGMNDRQVRDEVMTLLLAGHETTANTLTWTWYLLSQSPAALAALDAEVRRVLGDRPATTADLPQLAWTAAVIDEALRLHPPAYMTGREA